MIDKLNNERPKESSAYYGLTMFSDLSPEEFSKHKLQKSLSKRVRKHPGRRVSAAFHNHHHSHNHLVKRAIGSTPLPDKVDWFVKN